MIKTALTEFAIKRPKTVMFLVLGVTLIFLAAFPNLKTDTDPVHMLPQDNPAVTFYNEIKEEFKLNDMIGIGIQSKKGESLFTADGLNKVYKITEEILNINKMAALDENKSKSETELIVNEDVMSVSTVDDILLNENGELLVQPLMKTPPKTDREAQKIFERLGTNPLLAGKLVSEKGDLIGIFIPIKEGKKTEAYYLGTEIKKILKKHLGAGEKYYFAGLPIAESTFGSEMFIQMGIYAPMAGLVIFLLLLFFFRSFKIVIAPMILGFATVIMSMGALIYSGNVVHIMSSMIPIFLLPIAVLNSIHILSKLSYKISDFDNKEDAIRDVMNELFFPMLFTSLTTIIGFASLATTGIPPVMVFGITIAFGVFLSWLMSMVFIPAYTMLLSDKDLKTFRHRGEEKSLVVEFIHIFKHAAHKVPLRIIVSAILVLVISYFGIIKIVINDNPVRWFKKGHFLRTADEGMNKKLAGTYMAHLVFSVPEEVSSSSEKKNQDNGDEFSEFDDFADFETASEESVPSVRNPEVINYINDVQEYFKTLKFKDAPLIGGTSSVIDILKKIGNVAFDDTSIPQTREQISQYIFLYESGDSKKGKDLWKIIDRDSDSKSTQMWVYFKSGDNQLMSKAMNDLDVFLKNNPPPVFKDSNGNEVPLSVKWSGLMHINNVWQSMMVNGMKSALIGAFIIVFFMMVFLFRSFSWGLIAMLPLTITIVFIYGLIGFWGKFYDMPIAVLSSLTLGLSVDFAIHFIEHARFFNSRNKNFDKTFEEIFQGTAQAIWRNVLVISIGFSPLFFAGLIPYLTVGTFFFLIMIVSGITTLILMPAVLKKFHMWLPGFKEHI